MNKYNHLQAIQWVADGRNPLFSTDARTARYRLKLQVQEKGFSLGREKIVHQCSTVKKHYYKRHDSIFFPQVPGQRFDRCVRLCWSRLEWVQEPTSGGRSTLLPISDSVFLWQLCQLISQSHQNISWTLSRTDPSTKLNKERKRNTGCLEHREGASALTWSG